MSASFTSTDPKFKLERNPYRFRRLKPLYRKVIVKSQTAQERRELLRARKVATKMRMNVENTIRGLLASSAWCFLSICAPLTAHPGCRGACADALRYHPAVAPDPYGGATSGRRALQHTREDDACRRLMSIPGVGAVSAVTFVATIDDPARFRRSRSVGAYVGLTSRRFQSGEMDYGGRISQRGDQMLRTVLYEAANSLLCRAKAASAQGLKDWGNGVEEAHHSQKGSRCLTRKLAVIMHAIWRDGTTFELKEA